MKKIFFTLLLIPPVLFSYAQLNMEMLSHLPYTEELSDVWGYVDENGNEYALVGVYDGLSIVDVTDPSNPLEIEFLPGPQSTWRDMKTWGDYAYVGNETGGGVLIVDLGPLPGGSITTTTNFTGSQYPFQTSHNLYIDETGKLYIFGSDNGAGGAIICDLTLDPMNPVELGRYNGSYLHDGMARGDTLWGSALYQGVLAAIDVSDPQNITVMGTVSTPSQFTHNAWVSDNGSHVFTTDEVSSGFIGAFNVENVANMYETDRIRSSTMTDVIPHNVHVIDDFLVTSYYADGIVVHDALYPDKLFEVGNFDTSPAFSGSGYNGSWGTYPFLPSGVILASDIEEGLYVLGIDYIRAAFLEGTVTDKNTGTPLFAVEVEVLGTGLVTQTAFDGTYEFGTTISGIFNVQYTKSGYTTKVIEDVVFVNGETMTQDAELDNFIVGLAEDENEATISMRPNPFSHEMTLEYRLQEKEKYTLAVYNSAGQKMDSRNLSGQSGKITLGSDYTPGIYLIRLASEEKTLRLMKVVKH